MNRQPPGPRGVRWYLVEGVKLGVGHPVAVDRRVLARALFPGVLLAFLGSSLAHRPRDSAWHVRARRKWGRRATVSHVDEVASPRRIPAFAAAGPHGAYGSSREDGRAGEEGVSGACRGGRRRQVRGRESQRLLPPRRRDPRPRVATLLERAESSAAYIQVLSPKSAMGQTGKTRIVFDRHGNRVDADPELRVGTADTKLSSSVDPASLRRHHQLLQRQHFMNR